MLILVLAANMPVMFIGWEGVGLCSFLLIGFWYENEAYATAGRKAFVVNRIGDFAFLLGMFLLYWAHRRTSRQPRQARDGEPRLREHRGHPDLAGKDHDVRRCRSGCDEHFAAAAGIFLFIGACGKSRAAPALRVAARRDGRPDAGLGADPRGDDGHRRRLHGVPAVVPVRGVDDRADRRRDRRPHHRARRRVHGVRADRSEEGARVLDREPARLHVRRAPAPATGSPRSSTSRTHAFFKACLFLGAGSVMHGMEHGGSTTPGRHHDDGRPAQAHADHADHVHDLRASRSPASSRSPGSSRRTRSSPARGVWQPPRLAAVVTARSCGAGCSSPRSAPRSTCGGSTSWCSRATSARTPRSTRTSRRGR